MAHSPTFPLFTRVTVKKKFYHTKMEHYAKKLSLGGKRKKKHFLDRNEIHICLNMSLDILRNIINVKYFKY